MLPIRLLRLSRVEEVRDPLGRVTVAVEVGPGGGGRGVGDRSGDGVGGVTDEDVRRRVTRETYTFDGSWFSLVEVC